MSRRAAAAKTRPDVVVDIRTHCPDSMIETLFGGAPIVAEIKRFRATLRAAVPVHGAPFGQPGLRRWIAKTTKGRVLSVYAIDRETATRQVQPALVDGETIVEKCWGQPLEMSPVTLFERGR